MSVLSVYMPTPKFSTKRTHFYDLISKSPFLPFSEVIFNTLKTFAPLRPSCTFHLGPKLVVFIICYPVSHYIWFYFESEGGTLLTKIRKFWGKSCKIHNFLATGKFFTNFWGSSKFLIEWWVFHG